MHIRRGFDGQSEGDDYDLATSSFGDGDLGSPGTTGSTVLPVELIAFETAFDGREALPTWKMASEKSNAGFEVQQRREGAFERIGYVEGAGTTEEAQSYSSRTGELATGTRVFRLRQADYDGTSSYSDEAEAVYDLAVEDGTLVLQHRRLGQITLQPRPSTTSAAHGRSAKLSSSGTRLDASWAFALRKAGR